MFKWLRLLRKQHGYSQIELAHIANVEQSSIKLTQLAPTLDLPISLNRALKMEVRYLVDDSALTHSYKEV